MKHLSTISRRPQLAQQGTSDLSFLLSILGLVGALFTTFSTSFGTILQGVLAAATTYDSIKNPSGT